MKSRITIHLPYFYDPSIVLFYLARYKFVLFREGGLYQDRDIWSRYICLIRIGVFGPQSGRMGLIDQVNITITASRMSFLVMCNRGSGKVKCC